MSQGELSSLIILRREELRSQLLRDPRYAEPLRLLRSGAKYFSQGDEDGIIAEILRRVGTKSRFFVEIGIGDGTENNTLHLLLNGWRGVWIDGWGDGVARAREALAPFVASGQLNIIQALAAPDNVNGLLEGAGVPRNVDLLSIDIDGNDYHVLKALSVCRPRLAVLEYNASLGPTARWAMPFAAHHKWDETLVFGASLTALADLASGKGLSLVGCNLPGTNAFFVSNDEDLAQFHSPFTVEEHFEPPRYYLVPMYGGHRLPARGDTRLAAGRLE